VTRNVAVLVCFLCTFYDNKDFIQLLENVLQIVNRSVSTKQCVLHTTAVSMFHTNVHIVLVSQVLEVKPFLCKSN